MNYISPSLSAQKEITSFSRFIEPEAQAQELIKLNEVERLEAITTRMQKIILFKNKL